MAIDLLGFFVRLSSEVMIELAMRIDRTRKMTLWLGPKLKMPGGATENFPEWVDDIWN